MSTARLLAKLDEPNKVFFIASTPHETLAAHLRNYAVESMEKDDVANVAYYYLENEREMKVSIKDAALAGLTALSTIYTAIRSGHPGFLIGTLFTMLTFIPSVSCAMTYEETKNASAVWLGNRLGQDKADQIKSIPLTKEGLFTLADLLKKDSINTHHLEHLAENEEDGVLGFIKRWAYV